MNSKKSMFIAAAFLVLSAAACGKVDKESSDIALDINTATSEVVSTSKNSSETATTTTVTTSAVTDKEGMTTTKKGHSAKPNNSTHTTVAPDAAEPTQDVPEPDNQEPQTPPELEPEPTEPPTEPPTSAPVQDVEFNFASLQDNAANYIAGIPVQFTRGGGDACTNGGYDVVSYRSPEIVIDCYVDGGVEYIFSVTINENVCSTTEGITIGSSRADVVAAYGAGLGEPDSVLYNDGSKELWIDYSGDTVSCIQYYIAV